MSPEQRLEALELANTIRSYRAELKRNLATTEPRWRALRMCAEVIAQDPITPELETMKVRELISACRGIGSVKVAALCRPAAVTATLRLRDLSERQRVMLIDTLRMHAAVQAGDSPRLTYYKKPAAARW